MWSMSAVLQASDEHTNMWVSDQQLAVIQVLGFWTSTQSEPEMARLDGSTRNREKESGCPLVHIQLSGPPERPENQTKACFCTATFACVFSTKQWHLTDPERPPSCKPPEPAHVAPGANAGKAAVEAETADPSQDQLLIQFYSDVSFNRRKSDHFNSQTIRSSIIKADNLLLMPLSLCQNPPSLLSGSLLLYEELSPEKGLVSFEYTRCCQKDPLCFLLTWILI